MENDQKENLTDSTETSEKVAEETTETPEEKSDNVEETVESEETSKEVRVDKTRETPEQRLARLERQAKRERKKLGIKEQNGDSEMSMEDLYACVEAKVPREDIGEVRKAANLLGKSISEVLQDDIVKSILSRKAEQRQTALATSINGARRTSTKITDSEVIKKASSGIELSDDEMDRVVKTRLSPKKK